MREDARRAAGVGPGVGPGVLVLVCLTMGRGHYVCASCMAVKGCTDYAVVAAWADALLASRNYFSVSG